MGSSSPSSTSGYAHGREAEDDYEVRCTLVATNGQTYHGKRRWFLFAYRHALWVALQDVSPEVRIQSVYLSTNLKGFEGVSRIVPDSVLCAALEPYLAPGAYLTLEDGNGTKYGLGISRLGKAFRQYRKPGESTFTPKWVEGVNLPLSKLDREILRIFVCEIQQKGVRVYLTGTASGRGGLKAVLNTSVHGSSYRDIDVVLAKDVQAHDILSALLHALRRAGLSGDLKEAVECVRSDANRQWAPRTLWAVAKEAEVGNKADGAAPAPWDISFGESDLSRLFARATLEGHRYVRIRT